MNCQIFSDLAVDIARDQMMDAGARTQALAHASECLNCADRLEAEQRLTTDLRELVSATKDLIASAAVWENLSAGFDAREVVHVTASPRRWVYAAGAIAAMLLLMFALLPVVRRHPQPANVEAPNPTSSSAGREIQTINKEAGTEPKPDDVTVSFKQKPQVISHRHLPLRQTSAPPASQLKEIATDFIPLTYGDPNVGSDAQMVRVELPRSAMASFGLPVNMDRADQRVKADVLLGSDGLARAIRFVQ